METASEGVKVKLMVYRGYCNLDVCNWESKLRAFVQERSLTGFVSNFRSENLMKRKTVIGLELELSIDIRGMY